MDKILVLGSGGFTGKHFRKYVSKYRLTDDYDFLGVDAVTGDTETFPTVSLDLSDPERFLSLIKDFQPDYTLNLVGIFRANNRQTMIDVNFGIGSNLLEWTEKELFRPRKILLIGSAAEYGRSRDLPVGEDHPLRPVNNYGFTKTLQSRLLDYYNNVHPLSVCLARPFNIIGAGISESLSIGAFIKRIRDAEPGAEITVGNLNSKRDFLDIEDIIDAYWKILIHGAPGEVYNVCRGESVSINDVLTALIRISGKKVSFRVDSDLYQSRDLDDSFGDNRKIKHNLNWQPTVDVEESLRRAYEESL